MWKYVLERVLLIFLTAFIILSLTYILIQCLPVVEPQGTTAAEVYSFWIQQVKEGYFVEITQADVDAGTYSEYKSCIMNGTTYYFARLPLMTRYLNWLKNVFTEWNWGTSNRILLGQSGMAIIMMRLPVSMKLNIVAMCFSIPIGLGLGILAALKKNTWVDSLISTLIMVFISVPSFVVISFLMIWLCYNTGWLPSQWPTADEAANSATYAALAYVIPVASLSFGSIASFARYTRAELCEVMGSEFLLLARTKGLTRGQSVVKHALRNSMVPIVPMIISEFVSILSGSMILEQLYGINGIGDLFVTALTGNVDYAVVMCDMAVYTLIGLFATLIIDLSYGIVDPRIRMGAKK